MSEKLKLILAYQAGLYSMTELCLRFGISRKTAYKWLARYEAEGAEALPERSRAPLHSPARTSEEVEQALLATRHAHPSWGPKKLLAYLARRRSDLSLPSVSTAGRILSRHQLTRTRGRRRHWKHPGETPLVTTAPNDVWCADYKGEFRTRDGRYCYPLTVTDAHSRFLLGTDVVLSTQQVEARPVFQRLFQEYGLPEAIRTDNGVPFCTQAICGLSLLSVWWIKLGIQHQRIEPASPQQNGRHERMHRTMKAEATRPPEKNAAEQQVRFDTWRVEYNEVRPHEALQQTPPAEHYQRSSRDLPQALPAPVYPGHFEVRRVSRAGTFRMKSQQLFLSQTLEEEHIGLEETADGVWSLYFYHVLLCRLDERDWVLRD